MSLLRHFLLAKPCSLRSIENKTPLNNPSCKAQPAAPHIANGTQLQLSALNLLVIRIMITQYSEGLNLACT